MVYCVDFVLAGYEATLEETFTSESEARGVVASLEEKGAQLATVSHTK